MNWTGMVCDAGVREFGVVDANAGGYADAGVEMVMVVLDCSGPRRDGHLGSSLLTSRQTLNSMLDDWLSDSNEVLDWLIKRLNE